MLKTASLWFRVESAVWHSHAYLFEFPETVYLSKASAEDGMPDTHIALGWDDVSGRVASDIHNDA